MHLYSFGRTRTRISMAVFLLCISVMSYAGEYPRPTVPEDVVPAFRLEKILMSIDYFGQFLWGDTIFEDYLYQIFRLNQGAFTGGTGVTVEVVYGGETISIEQALLGSEGESDWWSLHISGAETDIYCEVLVHSLGVPLLIRYRNPETGAYHERTALMGQGLQEAVQSMGREAIDAEIQKEINRDLEDSFNRQYANLQLTGEVEYSFPSGKVMGVVAIEDMGDSGRVQYLFSPDIGGGLLTIKMDRDGNTNIVARLITAKSGYTPLISSSDIVPEQDESAFNAYGSEGSIDSPVFLDMYTEYYGTVGYGETSCYSFEPPENMDVQIELYEVSGYVSLSNYGKDDTFWALQSSASGSGSITLEHLSAEGGRMLYFSVDDSLWENPDGVSYVIRVGEY